MPGGRSAVKKSEQDFFDKLKKQGKAVLFPAFYQLSVSTSNL